MRREKTLELKLVTGDVCFVHRDEYDTMGIPDEPMSFIGSYIVGSRGPMLRVNTLADMTGTETFINPRHIVSLQVTYLD